MKEIKVAIIGYGGIAKAHYLGYTQLDAEGEPVKLVAVCDIDPERFTAKIKTNLYNNNESLPESIHRYTDVDELIANEEFDMADICLPTYLHKEYSVKLMAAGKHVMCEKPMALTGEECEEMLAASEKYDKKLMIGQCLRFNATYEYLKDAVVSGRYGKLRRLFLDRRSSQPLWSFEHWFEDTSKSGGCILDMHIHDIDMVRWLLGEPWAVSAITYDTVAKWAVENSRLYYSDTMVVVNGSWDEPRSCRFYWGFNAGFDDASIICDNGKVTVYPNDGESFNPEIIPKDHMAEEIRYFVSTILDGEENTVNPPESACKDIKLIEKLRESAARNGEIVKL